MGHLLHHTIVVSGWDAERVLKAHAAALSLFDDQKLTRLVSGIVQHATNGGASFFIAPDGSKEGWGTSDKGDAARKEFIEWLKSEPAEELFLEWALIVLGGDDGEYSIADHADKRSETDEVSQ